eukprot:9784464-Ditylum_brightwellii.AAC.1
MAIFTAMGLQEAKIWARKKSETLYPQQQQPPSAQPQPHPQHTPAIIQNMWFQQMFQQWQAQQTATSQPQVDTVEKPEDLVRMSKTELTK